MADKPITEEWMKDNIASILNTMKEVIMNPVGFFRTMPKRGGFIDPIIFVASMGVLMGVINLVLSIVGLGFTRSFGMAILYIVIMPLLSVVFGFVGAAILFIIWRIMGSPESYETAYRCGAYTSAITPVTTIIGIIPYLGGIVGIVWMAYITVCASVEVHGIKVKTAWIVFGILFGLLLLMNISGTYTARHFNSGMEQWEKTSQDFDKMSAEEKGKAAGEFLKGMEKAIKKE
ncbi:MAG TPA: YIP1 family protein [Syntrophales bacterium]|nr:YIP1 family protein [Syntrophales bacterium]